MEICNKRICENETDSWAIAVQTKINGCLDFVAAEARYHGNCYLRFSGVKSVTTATTPKPTGRKINEEMMAYFNETCDWLESEAIIHSVCDFRKQMVLIANKNDIYVRYIKKLLEKRYGTSYFFHSQTRKRKHHIL